MNDSENATGSPLTLAVRITQEGSHQFCASIESTHSPGFGCTGYGASQAQALIVAALGIERLAQQLKSQEPDRQMPQECRQGLVEPPAEPVPPLALWLQQELHTLGAAAPQAQSAVDVLRHEQAAKDRHASERIKALYEAAKEARIDHPPAGAQAQTPPAA